MTKKLRAVSAAAVGRSHSKRGEACADAVGTRCFGRSAAIAVLADGAGSSQYGVQAADMAVKEIIRHLGNTSQSTGGCTAETLRTAVLAVASKLEERASYSGVGIADYGTTLLVAYAQIKRGGLKYCIAHIGDGCILAATETSDLVLSEPRRGEHVNETYFLSTPNAERRARFLCGTLDPGFGLFLVSDGTASCLYDYEKRRAAPGCRVLSGWSSRLKISKLKHVLNKNVKDIFTAYTYDDCSIAILKPIGIRRARV